MAHHLHVGISLSDPHVVGAIREQLARHPKYCVSSFSSERSFVEPFPGGTVSFGINGNTFTKMDLVLFGLEDLVRFEEDDPERFNELHVRTKVVLVLGSEDLPDAMELLRLCDGMVVRDVNFGRISEIIDFALLGYFVIPRQMMLDLQLAGDPRQRALLKQMSSRERQVLELLGRGCSNAVIASEMRTTEAAVRNVVRKILKNGRSQPKSTVSAASRPAGAKLGSGSNEADATAPATRRKTLHDKSGVTRIEYVLFAAAFAIWAVIILDGFGVGSVAQVANRCAPPSASAQCQTLGEAGKRHPVEVRHERAEKSTPSSGVLGDAEHEAATR